MANNNDNDNNNNETQFILYMILCIMQDMIRLLIYTKSNKYGEANKQKK